MDQSIFDVIKKEKYKNFKYFHYFFPETKKFIDSKTLINEISKDLPDNFEEKRKNGENENYICELIRKDMIEEFIIFINKTICPLGTKIKQSIFETNTFLIKNEPALIEYAAFFGSIQIFKFLHKNNAKLTQSIWTYAVHSQNPEMIHYLEDIKFYPKDNACIIESIKCHHNDVTSYIQNNLTLNKNDIFVMQSLKYHNLYFTDAETIDESIFVELCKYDYISIVEILLKNNDIDINQKKVCILSFFMQFI